jgi:uncharacterized protein YecE (DUF72 family)
MKARAATEKQIRIGVSGWRYAPWRGAFYPADLPQKNELAYAASIFNSLEINGSFYSLQRRESWQHWYSQVPDDFVFAVKGGRFITHMLKLRNIETALANFFASGVLALNEKLGPVLWQLPPQMGFDPDVIESFVAQLPGDTEAALEIAQRFDARIMEGRTHLSIDRVRPMRHAMEIRHRSFLDERFVSILGRHNVALVVAETAKRWPMPCDVTADFVYLRLHGEKTLYQSGYGPKSLQRWADRIVAWHSGGEPDDMPADAVRVVPGAAPRAAKGRDVFCYFDNTDVKLRAPVDARNLMKKLGLGATLVRAR